MGQKAGVRAAPLLLVLGAMAACSHTSPHVTGSAPSAQDGGLPEAGDAAPAVTDAAGVSDAASGDGGAAGDGGADAGPPGLGLEGKRIFHAGDSLVGGEAGLSRFLHTKFKEEGAKYQSDTVVSASLMTFNLQARFPRGLQRARPDIVIITLGANDVFVPSPEVLAVHVKGIVKKIGDRECYWMSPATWKPDTGIVEVIKANAAPCKFFDSRNMTIPRAGDHIHPTDKGGAQWGEKFWAFFQAEHGHAATADADAGATGGGAPTVGAAAH
jgi:lysophospholipase L1-like esterase